MVEFVLTMDGFEVMVGGKPFGRLMKGVGFFTDPTVVKGHLVAPREDLIRIALKADEVRTHGIVIPVCQVCNGTPFFPGKVHDPDQGTVYCKAAIHPFCILWLANPRD